MSTLEEVFEEVPVVETPEKVEETVEATEDDKGEEVAVVAEESAEGETPTPEDKPEESWTKAAALDERRKRQKAEDERDRLQRELDAAKAPPKQERPDVFEDQEAAFKHVESEQDKKRINDKIELSQDFMRRTTEDYQEMEDTFVEMVKERPELAVQMRSHPNPAGYVYDTAKNKAEFDAMQDVGAYKSKMEAEMRQKLEAEIRSEFEEKLANKQALDDVGPSLTNVSSASTDVPVGSESLEEIMGS